MSVHLEQTDVYLPIRICLLSTNTMGCLLNNTVMRSGLETARSGSELFNIILLFFRRPHDVRFRAP